MNLSALMIPVVIMVVLAAAPAAGAASSPFQLGTASYRRGYVDPRIPGLGSENRSVGGRLYVALHNAGATPLRVSQLSLNRKDAEELIRDDKLFWWRVWPEEIPPQGSSTLTLVGGRPLLQEGARLKLSVRCEKGVAATGQFDLITPPLSIAYVVPTEDWRGLLVWLRNDDELNTLCVGEVGVAGLECRALPLCGTIAPGRSTIVRLRFKQLLKYLQPLQLIAHAEDQRGRQVACLAPIRALIPPFPIGTWNGPTYDAKHLTAMAEFGYDGLINGGSEADVAAMDELAKKHGYGLLSHVGWGPGNVRQSVLDNVAPKPWCLALALTDEPDLHSGARTGDMRSSTFTYLGGVEVWRRCESCPTFVNLCDDSKSYEFAPITDIVGYDAYAIGAPGIERSHVGYARDLETLAYHTWDLKRNAEPSPIWVWAQGYHAWVHRLLAGLLLGGEAGRAMVTPSECRVQLMQQLGRGAKGLWWFLARKKDDTRQGFHDELHEEGAEFGVTEDRFEALVEKAMEPWDELWAELGRLNSIVLQLRPMLTYADPYQQFVRDAGWVERADVATVAAEEALVIFVTNLSYYHTLQGALFRPIKDLSLTVERPPWIEVWDVFEVTPEGPRRAEWSAEGNALTIEAGPLTDVKVFVASASRELRAEMEDRALSAADPRPGR
ncbi:MAG: hypothetical protein JSV65_15805 [Armatimonadota bacterium]|nr:MAG: hypothetical protein JSV65_15805 [Armatimonadota bacterium]